ncbi:GNAT family N-acetyltransferase [Kitasatospora sp. MAA4]|uniref:GNAT family N-acetyltransferase n=1 Tax=Kitasatospora sp. MAA4 TaxID=3035093 RepID=UPI0024734596|nr:GNAT family N-acetyltransferase [Kitasatospora sp. MAA4]
MAEAGSSGWIVRRAGTRDLPGLVRLSRIDPVNESAASVAARVAGLLADPRRCIVVAESESESESETAGELVGVAEAQFYGVAMRRASGSARLHDLFVEPSWRRRGIARALFAEVTAWARGLPQCRDLEWQSSPAGEVRSVQLRPAEGP